MSNFREAVAARTEHCPRCHEDRLVDKHRTYSVCQVCAYRWDPRSYDERQIEAPLVTCNHCGEAFHMTQVMQPCARCQVT